MQEQAMTDLVEQVARVICQVDCGEVTDNELARCRDLSQAAIATVLGAMKEPSEGMGCAGGRNIFDYVLNEGDRVNDASAVWQAMLQAFASEHNVKIG